MIMSQCSSVNKVTGHDMDDWDSIPAEGKYYSLCNHIWNAYEAHPDVCPVSSGVLSLGVKRTEREAYH